jgi:hypothetical protein
MTTKKGAKPDADEADEGNNELAISEWAKMRKRKLPKTKWTLSENVALDPLSYTVIRYVNLPMACDQQMKIADLRKQFVLNYMASCRQKAPPGSPDAGSTIIVIYAPLLDKSDAIRDTCKLLQDDLKLFFMHDDDKQTMSPCMFPSIFENREMFTPEFFQTDDWRLRVKKDVRLLPDINKKKIFDHVFNPTAEWCLDKTKPFDSEVLEVKVRLAIIKFAARIRESVRRAYGLMFTQDRGRELLLVSALRQFRELTAKIDNFVDTGIDGAITLNEYAEEREIPDSAETIRIFARFSLEIKNVLGINMPV